MPTISLKLYLYAGLAVGAFALFLRYDYLSHRVKEQDEVIQKYSVAFERQKQQIKDADTERTNYLNTIEAGKNEIDDLRSRVSTGATVLHVAATCPKLPSTSTNSAGTIAASPELTEDARQSYFAHLSDENELNARLDLCVKTLQDERK